MKFKTMKELESLSINELNYLEDQLFHYREKVKNILNYKKYSKEDKVVKEV